MAYFAASTDDPGTNGKFAASLKLDYPILSDPGKETARAYGVLDGDYADRWTFYIGKDGRILAIDRDVRPATAGADVAKTLERLKVGRRAG